MYYVYYCSSFQDCSRGFNATKKGRIPHPNTADQFPGHKAGSGVRAQNTAPGCAPTWCAHQHQLGAYHAVHQDLLRVHHEQRTTTVAPTAPGGVGQGLMGGGDQNKGWHPSGIVDGSNSREEKWHKISSNISVRASQGTTIRRVHIIKSRGHLQFNKTLIIELFLLSTIKLRGHLNTADVHPQASPRACYSSEVSSPSKIFSLRLAKKKNSLITKHVSFFRKF